MGPSCHVEEMNTSYISHLRSAKKGLALKGFDRINYPGLPDLEYVRNLYEWMCVWSQKRNYSLSDILSKLKDVKAMAKLLQDCHKWGRMMRADPKAFPNMITSVGGHFLLVNMIRGTCLLHGFMRAIIREIETVCIPWTEAAISSKVPRQGFGRCVLCSWRIGNCLHTPNGYMVGVCSRLSCRKFVANLVPTWTVVEEENPAKRQCNPSAAPRSPAVFLYSSIL